MNLPARWTSLEMIFYDMLYITYLVPTERVSRVMPEDVTPVEINGGHVAVAVWLFHVLEAKAARVPSPRVSYHQINVYTFVHDPVTSERALFLLRAGVTSPWVARLARWLGVPVDVVQLQIVPERDKRLRYQHYRATGDWGGPLQVEADEVAPRLEEAPPPFSSPQEAVVHLTDMLVGLYAQGPKLHRVEAWHPRLQPRVAQVDVVRLPVLAQLGIVTEEEMVHPHSVFLAPRGHYLLHLPPQRVTARASQDGGARGEKREGETYI